MLLEIPTIVVAVDTIDLAQLEPSPPVLRVVGLLLYSVNPFSILILIGGISYLLWRSSEGCEAVLESRLGQSGE